jgi:hypothetical protein
MTMDDGAFGAGLMEAPEFAGCFRRGLTCQAEDGTPQMAGRYRQTYARGAFRLASSLHVQRLNMSAALRNAMRTSCSPIWRRERAFGQCASELGVSENRDCSFGHRPMIADTFCGGGSIPLKPRARMRCLSFRSQSDRLQVYVGVFNIIGGEATRRKLRSTER